MLNTFSRLENSGNVRDVATFRLQIFTSINCVIQPNRSCELQFFCHVPGFISWERKVSLDC